VSDPRTRAIAATDRVPLIAAISRTWPPWSDQSDTPDKPHQKSSRETNQQADRKTVNIRALGQVCMCLKVWDDWDDWGVPVVFSLSGTIRPGARGSSGTIALVGGRRRLLRRFMGRDRRKLAACGPRE
jgi:hypothetical protein